MQQTYLVMLLPINNDVMNVTPAKTQLDENVVRLVAAQVVAVAVTILVTLNPHLAIALAVDFALRAFTGLPALTAVTGKFIAKQLKLTPAPIFAPPKKFAASVGFLFATVITALLFAELNTAAYAVGGILVFFAFLESAFSICVGCYVYNYVVAPLLKK